MGLHRIDWIIIGLYLASMVVIGLPTDEKVLMEFYRVTRPWGFWKPIQELVITADPGFKRNTEFRRDAVNVGVGIVWQLCLTIVPIYVVLKQGLPLAVSVGVLLITSVILKYNWYDRLERA